VKDALAVGVMSGTSLDGVSAALVRLNDGPGAELVAFHQESYAAAERGQIIDAIARGGAKDLALLHVALGERFAGAVLQLLSKAKTAPPDLAFVASHGQTIWHEPGHSTWQTGEPAVLAERTGIDVISDFRVRDVAARGQGAPLVPMADAMLFSSPTDWRGLQNLGGIGNITIVPPGGDVSGVRAFDTGPGVAVIDGVVKALWPQLAFDADGKLARRGKAVMPVVDELMKHPYFSMDPPKSTGRELFNSDYVQKLISSSRAIGATDEDIVATAVQLTAVSVADAYRRFIPEPMREVLVSGGGGKNPALFEAIRNAAAPMVVRHFDEVYFDGEAKEAVAFALLGYLHVMKRPGNVPSATGARGPRILGKRTPA